MRIPALNMRQKVTPLTIRNGPDGPIKTLGTPIRAGVEFTNRVITDSTGAQRVIFATVTLDVENVVKVESFLDLNVGTVHENEAKVVMVKHLTPLRQAPSIVVYCELRRV